MIRGISRQIIEVKETKNIYYESAYLVVKPEFSNAEREVLEREALKVLKTMDAPACIKRRFGRWTPWLKLLLPTIMGAGIATAVCCGILL